MVATLVAGLQLYYEYNSTKKQIQKELSHLETTFAPTLSSALFVFDEDLLNVTLKGILENPVVESVHIFDDKGKLLRSNGSNITDISDKTLSHSFDLIYKKDNFKFGSVIIYSEPRVILNKIENGISLILINTIFETSLLFLIIVVLLRKFLAIPMRIFSRTIRDLDFNNLETISLDYPYENELTNLH